MAQKYRIKVENDKFTARRTTYTFGNTRITTGIPYNEGETHDNRRKANVSCSLAAVDLRVGHTTLRVRSRQAPGHRAEGPRVLNQLVQENVDMITDLLSYYQSVTYKALSQ